MSRHLLPLVLLLGCGTPAPDPDDSSAELDADGDGFSAAEDCDDDDEAVNPDAAELCNGVDDDCDGTADVGATDTISVYTDADGDGFGDPATETAACEVGADQSDNGDDCDDSTDAVSPAAVETCNDVDDDCDGDVDEEAVDAATWYPDVDGDGYGDAAVSVTQCAPPGEVSTTTGGDCDDANAEVSPGAEERCDGIDGDCNAGTADSGVWSVHDGVWTDRTSTVAAGTAAAPLSASLDGGTLHVCDGTWYVNLVVTASAEIVGHTDTVQATLSAGDFGSTIRTRGTEGPVDVRVSDLAIEGGTGSYSEAASFSGGGGVLCDGMGTDTLELVGVTVSGGVAYTGGGVFGADCDVTVVDSWITGNDADYGGGLLSYGRHYGVALVVEDSVIEGNTASNSGGGVYLEAYTTSTFDLVDSWVTENTTPGYGGGLATYYAVTTTCTGDASVTSGFQGNSATAGGAIMFGLYGLTGSVTGTGCDMGDAETAADNSPHDVYSVDWATGYTFGDDADFICDSAGCR